MRTSEDSNKIFRITLSKNYIFYYKLPCQVDIGPSFVNFIDKLYFIVPILLLASKEIRRILQNRGKTHRTSIILMILWIKLMTRMTR